jgi:flavodoxin-B
MDKVTGKGKTDSKGDGKLAKETSSDKKSAKEQEEPLRLTADLEGNYLLDERTSEMKWLGIFYSPAGGNVHRVAKMLKKKIGANKVDMFCVNDVPAGKLLDYKNLILVCSSLGRSTWEREQRDKWAKFFPQMRKISLKDRFVALVGLGDHITYPKNFVDGMGYMAELVSGLGATLVGKTSTDGYVYEDSTAVVDDLFVGLPLDEDFEPEKTNARIDKWLDMVLPEFEEV